MAFLLLLLLLTVVGSSWACPWECRCSLDERGRRQVRCEAGGMKKQLPVSHMSEDTEVLVISAPPGKPNALTLGPIFNKLRRLEEVHITHSKIPALGAHSFWHLHRLHVLNLTNNYISALMDTNFEGANALHHLDLSHNRIRSVPSAVFRYVHHLRTLTLAHNLIPDLVPRIFFGLARLERLDLSHNPLKELLAERFTDAPELRQLYCAGCHISSITESLLLTLPQLRELDLRNNRLQQVPLGIASNALPRLITLRLDGNRISYLESGVIAGSPLISLHLAHNHINRLEVDAFTNSSLKNLDLSYNRLTQLEPSTIKDVLHQLHDLQLSGNSLYVDQLLTVLPKARQLRRLGLGDMGLTSLPPEVLRHSRHLHHLNLSANYLTSFSTEILSNAPHLYSLDISHNIFRGMDSNFFVAVTAAVELRTLRLEGNPWHCDQCHVGPLLRWLQDAPDQESGCQEPRVWSCLQCIGPKGVAGQHLALLPLGDLPTCPFTTPAAEAVMPTWLEPSLTAITDEPEFPLGQLTRQENITVGWSVKEELYLMILAGSVLVMLLTALIVIGIVLYNRHTAFYYTNEEDSKKRQRFMKLKDSKNNNSPATKTSSVGQLDTTIDEMTVIAVTDDVLEEDNQNHVNGYSPAPTIDNIINETCNEIFTMEHSLSENYNQEQHQTPPLSPCRVSNSIEGLSYTQTENITEEKRTSSSPTV